MHMFITNEENKLLKAHIHSSQVEEVRYNRPRKLCIVDYLNGKPEPLNPPSQSPTETRQFLIGENPPTDLNSQPKTAKLVNGDQYKV